MSDQHVPVPNVASALSKLGSSVQTLQAGDVWKDWLEAYARDRREGWQPAGINPILTTPWLGAPFRVKGEQIWPGAAISRRAAAGHILHLGQAARWTMAMTGSGNAMHPTWVGSTLVFAALGDITVAEKPPFTLVRADRLPLGSRLLAATSISKLNHGIPLGATAEKKLQFPSGVGLTGFHVCASDQTLFTAKVIADLDKALSGWRGHVRFQRGFLVAWHWHGKKAAAWRSEADAALDVLVAVRAAVFGAATTSAAESQVLTHAASSHTTSRSAAAPMTLRYAGQTRRDPATGAIEVSKPPKLKLPRGASGTLVRWRVAPRDMLSKGQPIAVLRLETGQEVDLLCPRAGHRVVRRCGVGSTVHDRSVIVSLERLT